MRPAVLLLLTLAPVAAAAPVPRPAPPDPLGRGYLGVFLNADSISLSSVVAGGPADQAGLKAGDRYVKVGPVEPKKDGEVRDYLGGLRPGTKVRITVKRGTESVTVVVTLADRPANFNTMQAPSAPRMPDDP